MSRTAPALLLPILLYGCATPRQGGPVTVLSEGWAPESPGDAEGSRRRAVADALRRAVESAAGVTVTARTRVRDGAAARSQVVADAAGCVRRYEVLKESASAGGRRASVRAMVEPAAVCGRSPLPTATLEGAAVEILVLSPGAPDAAAARSAAATLRGELAARGWRVVASGAPWRLSGLAMVRPVPDPRVMPLTGAAADLTLRAERAKGGVVVWEGHQSASALGVDADSAGREAASAAAARAAAAAVEALEGDLWDSTARH